MELFSSYEMAESPHPSHSKPNSYQLDKRLFICTSNAEHSRANSMDGKNNWNSWTYNALKMSNPGSSGGSVYPSPFMGSTCK
eukprot:scaffold5837_cov76-Cyclotella_meneghiniana.AAC.3